MMEYVRIATELIFGFVSLLVLTKVLGKTQITQLTAFDFISAIVLGELVGNALYDKETGVAKILFAVGVWALLIFIAQLIAIRFKKTRSLLEGKPSIVIYQGKIMYKELKKNRLVINQLLHLLRQKDVFSLREVEHAIIETDGKLSVMRKSEYESPTRGDHKMQQQEVNLAYTLITDGEVIWDNLKESGVDENWLGHQVYSKGYKDYSQVLYFEWEQGKEPVVQGY